jgi:hypothetical protein
MMTLRAYLEVMSFLKTSVGSYEFEDCGAKSCHSDCTVDSVHIICDINVLTVTNMSGRGMSSHDIQECNRHN